MSKLTKLFLIVIVVALVVILGGKIIELSVGRQISFVCQKLEIQSVQFDGPFFLTADQKKMCDKAGIAINAPVKHKTPAL